MIKWGIPGTPILDAIVFNKIKEATGGNLRMALSGGALIAKETQEFLSLTVCTIFNGYGLTETAA
jgi:long-chain acyl-CoA synthetase